MLNCVAVAQRRARRSYSRELGWRDAGARLATRLADDAGYDIRPGQEAWLMSLAPDGEQRIACVRWGYGAVLAHVMPMALSARIEKATNGRYSTLWRYGRAILPADGWYFDAAPEGTHKALRFVRRSEGRSLFVAAISNYWIAGDGIESAGFLIVTGEPGEGIAAERDREPLVLGAEDARLWLDPKLSVEQAKRLVTGVACTPDVFDVHVEEDGLAEPKPQDRGMRAGSMLKS